MKTYAAICLCCLLFSQAAFAQDFSSLDSDLQLLEDLIADTLTSTQEQQRLLNDLRESLHESGTLITNYESIMTEQEALLKDLQTLVNEMSEIYRTQSALSARYAQRSKFWRTFTLVGIPIAALLSGSIVWAASR